MLITAQRSVFLEIGSPGATGDASRGYRVGALHGTASFHCYPVAGVTNPRPPGCNGRIDWIAPHRRLAMLSTSPKQGSTLADLLPIARRIDLSRTTPIHTPLRLTTAPPPMRVLQWWIDTRARAPGNSSVAHVVLGRSMQAQRVRLTLTDQRWQQPPPGATPLSVRGHQAYWQPAVGSLTVRYRPWVLHLARYFKHVEVPLRALVAIAKTVQVAHDPRRPNTWFTLSQANP